ncbi:hypothetical protein SLEP1_g28797 [Rubroshorea leprosula]|uniref:Uncharacterized protein n=1 Tax=Rubroshorea leprosula TaxID=152421 RepID=A0AAV5JUW9_9ROSI|nr:hypothetical protein SLEP1_g28797 [Rubroshorea leprosula]
MTVNKNWLLKRPFEETEWENAPITFSAADYKRAEGEPDNMMPHADPFVAPVHIEPRFRMASVSFLVVKMESAFNAILGRATLYELKAVISQPHLCMKFPTPQGVGVLKGNQKMAKTYYQDTFKKVELVATLRGSSESHRLTQHGQQTMSILDIEHRPEGVEQKAEPVELVETVPLNPDFLERTIKVDTKLATEERAELLEFLRVNQDVFAWTMDEMPGILAELIVHKLSTDPMKRLMVQKRRLFGLEKQATIDEEIQKLLQASFIRRVEYFEWVSNPVLVKKPNGKWRMCIDFTNLNEACLKDPYPLPNVEKLVERAVEHERMSFLDASSSYHQVQLLLDDQEKIAFYAGDAIYYYVMMPSGLKNASATYQKLVVFKLQISRNIEVYVDDMIVTTPLLSKPVEGENLYLYLGVTKEAVSSVLLREENKHQKPIYYVSKVLQDAEQNYPLAEKATFALPRTTLKGQAVADFLVECLSATVEERAPKYPVWVLYVDGAANIEESGAGAVLVGLDGFKSEHELRFKFQTTNNAAEYEALIYGLKLASELKVQSIKVFSDSQLVVGQVNGSCEIRDPQLGRYASVVNRLKSGFASFQINKIPRAHNQRADELSKLASSQDINPQRSTIVEVLDAPSYTNFTIECQLLSTNPSSPSWTTPLIEYLRSGELSEDPSTAKLIKRRAAHFTLLDNQLYKYRARSKVRTNFMFVYKLSISVFVERGEMLSSLSSPWPFAQWGVDLLGPFVKGKGGCTYLVVAVDYFTKWIEAKPLSMTTKKKIEEFLFDSILCRFGIPKRIIADNGPSSEQRH